MFYLISIETENQEVKIGEVDELPYDISSRKALRGLSGREWCDHRKTGSS